MRIEASDAGLKSLCVPGFELYLQFDSLRAAPYRELRGRELLEIKLRALERLNQYGINTTLVTTIKRGTNEDELGELTRFALAQRCVRGITFQPVQHAGRTEGFDPESDRMTLGEVRSRLLAQQDIFAAEDVIPVPCHPDCLAMAYALKVDGAVVPLSRAIDKQVLLDAEHSTIVYEKSPEIRARVFDLFSTSHSPSSSAGALRQLLCCLPNVDAPAALHYENVFRVLILQFLDAHNFDVRSVKRSCIHIVHPEDGRLIPFDTYNMFYRDQKERTVLTQLRRA